MLLYKTHLLGNGKQGIVTHGSLLLKMIFPLVGNIIYFCVLVSKNLFFCSFVEKKSVPLSFLGNNVLFLHCH